MFVEESFYLFFPMIFLFFRGKLRAFIFVLIGGLIYYSWMEICDYYFPSNPNLIRGRALFAHVIDFGIGIFIFYAKDSMKFINRKKIFNVFFFLFLLLLCILACIYDYHFLAGGLVFYCFSQDSFLKDWVSKDGFYFIRFLGIRCLSLYLLHDLVLMGMIKVWNVFPVGSIIESSSFIYIAIYLGICFSIVDFSYRYVECNSRRLGDLFLRKLRT